MHPRFHALDAPDRAAAIMSDTGATLTYGALEDAANRGAQLLRRLGIRTGDAIAVWLHNGLSYFECYWSAQRAGVHMVPISTALTADEATYILADSGARLLLCGGDVAGVAPLLAGAWRDRRDHVLWVDRAVDGVSSWAEYTAREPAVPIADERAGFHMVYSSGTTGRPKGVKVPLADTPATAEDGLAIRQRDGFGLRSDSIYLSPAPLYHTAPLSFSATVQRLGGTVVVMPKFEAEAALAAIERWHVTITQMVPTMFQRMLRLPDAVRERYDISSLERVIHAAAPCPVDVKQQMIAWLGPIVYEYYGGSEGNGSTFITPEEWLRKPGSVGRANWGVLHICDDAGDEVSAGEKGLVYFEGGWDFAYLNDPTKTSEARNPKHPAWSTLGDVGYVDDDGYLFLTDRKGFMIISGGVNIYPQEVENLLSSHPRIADVAVIGVPNTEMGEEVKAVVQPLDWNDATPAFASELLAWCRESLSSIKCPRSIDFDRALPRHETGKLYKRLIRDRYWVIPVERVG